MQTESKIILNNTNETIEILDASMNPMSQLHYATSQKNIPLEWTVQSPNCQVETTIEETTVEVIPVEVPPISTEIIPP